MRVSGRHGQKASLILSRKISADGAFCSAARCFLFSCKQRLFAFDSPAVPAQASVLPHNTMAGDQNRRRIRGAGAGHGALAFRKSNAAGESAVTSRAAPRNLLQRFPNPALKSGGLDVEG